MVQSYITYTPSLRCLLLSDYSIRFREKTGNYIYMSYMKSLILKNIYFKDCFTRKP